MSEPVLLAIDSGVADLRLNRPDKRNALDDATFAGLIRATDALVADRNIRAVVLRGEGQAFCAGLDFASFRAFAAESEAGERPFGDPGRPGSGRREPGRGQRIVKNLRAIAAPVIAAIQGPAIGGGLQLALGADLRLVGASAVLSAREIQYGITLDMGGTQLLPRLVGSDRALEMIVTGRMVGAAEAVAIGLATALHDDPVAAAFAMAAMISDRSPDAVSLSKRLVRLAETATVDEGMAIELDVMARNIGRRNQVEAVTAFFDKRDPAFVEREVLLD